MHGQHPPLAIPWTSFLSKLHEAVLTSKRVVGIGYDSATCGPRRRILRCWRTFRPRLSFMDIYDKMCFTVSSAVAAVAHRWRPLIVGPIPM